MSSERAKIVLRLINIHNEISRVRIIYRKPAYTELSSNTNQVNTYALLITRLSNTELIYRVHTVFYYNHKCYGLAGSPYRYRNVEIK